MWGEGTGGGKSFELLVPNVNKCVYFKEDKLVVVPVVHDGVYKVLY